MAAEPHETHEFRNAVTYTIAVTVTVRGGARRHTADRRAEAVAEKLANHAARLADVVAVAASAGRNINGEIILPQTVRFAAANSGHPDRFEASGKLDRYLDPDHERALRSQAEAEARRRALADADRARRRELGCRNPYAHGDAVACRCAYCDPETHYRRADAERRPGVSVWGYACLCGAPVGWHGQRCAHHQRARLVVLAGDGAALPLLASQHGRGRATTDPCRPEPGQGLER